MKVEEPLSSCHGRRHNEPQVPQTDLKFWSIARGALPILKSFVSFAVLCSASTVVARSKSAVQAHQELLDRLEVWFDKIEDAGPCTPKP